MAAFLLDKEMFIFRPVLTGRESDFQARFEKTFFCHILWELWKNIFSNFSRRFLITNTFFFNLNHNYYKVLGLRKRTSWKTKPFSRIVLTFHFLKKMLYWSQNFSQTLSIHSQISRVFSITWTFFLTVGQNNFGKKTQCCLDLCVLKTFSCRLVRYFGTKICYDNR